MDYWRQTDIVTPSDFSKYKVTVIGAGGIGSPTTLALAKLGVENITIYDDDKVEKHNLPNQMYRLSDDGESKVEATRDICEDFSGTVISTCEEKFEDQQIGGIVVSGVDSMKSREAIWKKIKYNTNVDLYIDARMGAEVCRIFSIKPCNPDDVKWYEKKLFKDDDASEEPCTARSVIYNTFTIAGLIASQMKKFVRAQPFSRDVVFDIGSLILIAN